MCECLIDVECDGVVVKYHYNIYWSVNDRLWKNSGDPALFVY